jgi:hypothetical protein
MRAEERNGSQETEENDQASEEGKEARSNQSTDCKAVVIVFPKQQGSWAAARVAAALLDLRGR